MGHGRQAPSAVDHEQIYRTQPESYDRLVAREDYQGNLARALTDLMPSSGAVIVDLGTGTGRLARLLTRGQRIIASDRSLAMLQVASRRTVAGLANVNYLAADNRWVPLRGASADVVLAGWTLGHSVSWYGETWPVEIGRALGEMMRVVRQPGLLVIVETLGTGIEAPRAPTQGLADYYRWLEETHGFERRWLRTDYRFETPEEAVSLIRFFFGDDLAGRVASEGGTLVPECTGLWLRSLTAAQT